MIVIASKLQRTITYTGIDKVLKISTDAGGYLHRLGRSTREPDSVINLVTNLKAELDKVPSSEQDPVAHEVDPDVAKVWLTALTEYTRSVTLLEKKVAAQPELGGIRNANTSEEAANKLATQMQEQLQLPIQSLESLMAEQEQREATEQRTAEDQAFVDGVSPAPHRGRRSSAGTDPLAVGAQATHTPQPARPTKQKNWKGGQHYQKKREPQLPPVAD
jgi:hypothetical protein